MTGWWLHAALYDQNRGNYLVDVPPTHTYILRKATLIYVSCMVSSDTYYLLLKPAHHTGEFSFFIIRYDSTIKRETFNSMRSAFNSFSHNQAKRSVL